MKPTVLCIMDGWGISPDQEFNAIAKAKTPIFDSLLKQWPHGVMQASGEHVGLPEGQMGNSEVGHMNLGAGRVVLQDLPRINNVIRTKSLKQNAVLEEFIKVNKKSGGVCHLIGLLSDGGVHSHQLHIESLASIISSAGVPVLLHAILDGRDSPPKSALPFIKSFMDHANGLTSIASLVGRFYAMDRDNRWERIEKAYKAIVHGEGLQVENLIYGLEGEYKGGITDEFIKPLISCSYTGMQKGDTLLFANFRADRARELLSAIADPEFQHFTRKAAPPLAAKAGLVSYSSTLNTQLETLFPSINLTDTLGEVISNAGLNQLRVAETEKYPHVTFFLNGGREVSFPGEDRILIPSPKVATYDSKPEMSAKEVTLSLIREISRKKFEFIVVNYANPDMVGHTGDLSAAIKAVETVDYCIGELVSELLEHDGRMFLTADHGNCEVMFNKLTKEPHTAHTTNLVPTILVNAPAHVQSLKPSKLADVAPTLLELMNIPTPTSMTGSSMLSDVKDV